MFLLTRNFQDRSFPVTNKKGTLIGRGVVEPCYGGLPNIVGCLEKCSFLPMLNNELPRQRNSTRKQQFSRLRNQVLIMFENDTVLVPKETSWFGFCPDGALRPVLPPQQTTLYIEDWIGLKNLDRAGKVKYISVPGNHIKISKNDMIKHVKEGR